MNMDEYIEAADRLLESVETAVKISAEEAAPTLQKVAGYLFNAYLTAHETENDGGLREAYRRCLGLNADFETVSAAVDDMLADPGDLDEETLIDAANEIWDFVTGMLEEEFE